MHGNDRDLWSIECKRPHRRHSGIVRAGEVDEVKHLDLFRDVLEPLSALLVESEHWFVERPVDAGRDAQATWFGDRLDPGRYVQGVAHVASVAIHEHRPHVDAHAESQTLELRDSRIVGRERVRDRNGGVDSGFALVEDRHEVVSDEVHERASSGGHLFCHEGSRCAHRVGRVVSVVREQSAVADNVSVQCDENVVRDGALPWNGTPL